MRASALIAGGLVFVSLGAGGCGSEDERLEQAHESLASSCATAAATQSFVGGIRVTSADSYGSASCPSSVIYDVTKYNGSLGATTGRNTLVTNVYLDWTAGSVLNISQAECTGLSLSADLYLQGSTSLYKHFSAAGLYAYQADLHRPRCYLPSLALGQDVLPLWTNIRFVVSGWDTLANATRAVRLETLANGGVDQCLGESVDACTQVCNPSTGAITTAPPLGIGGNSNYCPG